MREFEAIFFDFDGTLMDSEPVHCECWREALAPLGVRVTWEAYAEHCVGAADQDMMRVFARLVEPPADPARLWLEYPRKLELFRARMVANPPFAAGIAEFLRGLVAHYKLALVSSSTHGEIEPPLEAAGIRRYFATLVGGEDVARHKPAPDPYLEAARRLGVLRALVVEDSAAGMASARAAGFEAVRVADAARMMEVVRARLDGA